jgi:hypothetical protein
MSQLLDREVSLYLSVLREGEASGAFRLRHPALTPIRNLVALEDAYGFNLLAKVPPRSRRYRPRPMSLTAPGFAVPGGRLDGQGLRDEELVQLRHWHNGCQELGSVGVRPAELDIKVRIAFISQQSRCRLSRAGDGGRTGTRGHGQTEQTMVGRRAVPALRRRPARGRALFWPAHRARG